MNTTDLTQPIVSKAKIRRPGAGRVKGSFSFVPISLADLNSKFLDKTVKILASRKQMEALGFQGLTTGKISELNESIAGQSAETTPKINAVEFWFHEIPPLLENL